MCSLDATDRILINSLQSGFPLAERPFAEIADRFQVDEATLIERIRSLKDRGYITRLGPLYDIERLGGRYSLAALAVPADRWDEVVAYVNEMPEIAHNYAREHQYNMWFVIAVADPTDTNRVIERIETATGLEALVLPKIREYFIGLRIRA